MSIELGGSGKNVWWLYQARRVNTQTNVAGGALTTRVSIPTGQVAKVVRLYVQGTASATATLFGYVFDEDTAGVSFIGSVPAGASRTFHLPSIGSGAVAHNNVADTTNMILGPGEYLVAVSSVAIQNEAQTVGVVLLLSTPTEPTWDTTGSAGTPSLAASTISAANTLQAVVM